MNKQVCRLTKFFLMRARFQTLYLLVLFLWAALGSIIAPIKLSAQSLILVCANAGASCLWAEEQPSNAKTPLLLIHGWHEGEGIWNEFITYFKNNPAASPLRDKYQIYRHIYPSDKFPIEQLGSGLRSVMDSFDASYPQTFSGKPIAIVAHSMGGLVARAFMRAVQGGTVSKLITLGTPHYGSPMANGLARSSNQIFSQRLLWIDRNLMGGTDPLKQNRMDLHWDSLSSGFGDHGLDYAHHTEEYNMWLWGLNSSTTTYDNRIIAYGGTIQHDINAAGTCVSELIFSDPDNYFCGAIFISELFNFESDGVVPIESATFENNPFVTKRQIPDYNHYEIVVGKFSGDTRVFSVIKQDLLDSNLALHSDLLPRNARVSASTVAPGEQLTISWDLANQGDAKASASSSTVVRFSRSQTSTGPKINFGPVPTGTLDPHSSVPQALTVSAPKTQGTYYAWVIADNFGDVTNQGLNTKNDIVRSAPFTVASPATALVVNGISASYPAQDTPFRPVISLNGSGFTSVIQISWTCTLPDGASCGAIAPWTPENWTGKFTPTSDSAATISPVFLMPGNPAGMYLWTVTFATASAVVAKSFTVSLTQQGSYATATGVGASSYNSIFGQSISFTASVGSSGGIPIGSVTLKDGSSTIGGPVNLSNGIASFSLASLSVGTHTITAEYSGSATFNPSTSAPINVAVQPQSQPQLVVNPANTNLSWQVGSSFPSIQFQVSASSGTLDFTVAQMPWWLNAATSSGTAGATPTPVTFTLNSGASSLPPGTYSGDIFFALPGGGVGSVFRTVTLTVTAPPLGELVISPGPATGLTSVGDLGGPFSPTSLDYFVSSTSGSLNYSISVSPAYFDLSTTMGTVGTAPTKVTVTLASSATSTPVGTYNCTITFTNRTTGTTQTRTATLVVNDLPALQVTPENQIQSSGNQGGPFFPESFQYRLAATKGSVHYSILFVPSWLTASSTSDTVTTAGTTVTFTVNDPAKALAAGGYSATIAFLNDTNGYTGPGSQSRSATLTVIGPATGPSFQGLGQLPAGSASVANGVSADGNVAVGLANQLINNVLSERAFRWAPSNGMVSLGVLPNGVKSEAFGANSDGTVVVGDSFLSGENGQRAFHWANGTMTEIGILPNYLYSGAQAVNSNGTVVVGTSGAGASGAQAYRWVNGSGMTGLGFLPGQNFSIARDVNADGSVVVGYTCGPDFCGLRHAFRWTASTGMVDLGFLPGGNQAFAYGVNSDGSVVVGWSVDAATTNTQAFRWVNGSMTGLGFLPGSSNSFAIAVNADGTVVVGDSGKAMRWTPTDGMRSIEDLLTAAGVSFAGWSLTNATGVSGDGTVIVGYGTHSGRQEGWIARLPMSTSALHINPATDIATSGTQGGPFTPSSFQYQLSASSGSVDYAITNIPSWLNASSTSGTVTAAGTTVTFTVNSAASSFSPGTYGPLPIAFANVNSDQGSTSRAATVTVNPPQPGSMQMTSNTGMSAAGTQGGPFSPSSFSYTLSSTTGSVGYSIAGLPTWLTASSTSGTATVEGTTVTFTLNSSANSLALGTHNATITVTNTTNGQGNTTRSVTLTVNPTPPPPTCVLSANPTTINQGQSSLLSWTSTDAITGSITNIGSVGPAGSQTVFPSQTTTYAGTFTGPGGNTNCQTTITVIAPPPNDNFADAITIQGGQTLTGTNAGATKEGGELNHAGNSGGKSLWWKFTAAANGQVKVSTANSSFDTLLAVYTGSAVNALTPVASNNDHGGAATSFVVFNVVAGTNYSIALDGFNGATGNISLSMSAPNAQLTCGMQAQLADFNGDGKTDILTRHTDGAIGLYLMNGFQSTANQIVATVDPQWKIVGAGDFNGDGKADFLMRHTDGRLAIYLMNGFQVLGSQVIGAVGNDWVVVGVGDFNGDGKADFMTRRMTDGSFAIYLMNGFQNIDAQIIGSASLQWSVVGVGDFNGDHKADFVVRHTDGSFAIYLMNGFQILASEVAAIIGNEWTFSGVADFDANGKSDFVNRRTDGSFAIFLMNGTQFASATIIGAVGNEWALLGVGDFNGDGKADFINRRTTDASVAIFLMNVLEFSDAQIIVLPGC